MQKVFTCFAEGNCVIFTRKKMFIKYCFEKKIKSQFLFGNAVILLFRIHKR